jgi:hypothetical protein
MEINDIIQQLPEENRAEVTDFLNNLNPIAKIENKDQALEFIKNNSLLNSAYDSAVSKGVEKFKANHLDIAVKEAEEKARADERAKVTKELNPEITPEQERLNNLEKANNDLLATLNKKEQKEVGLNYIKTALPGDAQTISELYNIDRYVGQNQTETIENLEKNIINPFKNFKEKQDTAIKEIVEKTISERLKQSQHTPGRSKVQTTNEKIELKGNWQDTLANTPYYEK